MKRCKECLDPIKGSKYDYCGACRRKYREEEHNKYFPTDNADIPLTEACLAHTGARIWRRI